MKVKSNKIEVEKFYADGDFASKCIPIVANCISALDSDIKNTKFNDTSISYFARGIADVIRSKKKYIDIAIVYHRDLDGGTAAMIVADFIRAISNYIDIFPVVEMISINYNSNLNKIARKILSAADLVISVDYSSTNIDHMHCILCKGDNPDKDVIFIDHHATSLIDISDADSEFSQLLNKEHVKYLISEQDGCSAALLTYILFTYVLKYILRSKQPDNIARYISTLDPNPDYKMALAMSVPEYIMHVSLYDTFHIYADRRFSLGVNTIKHIPFDLVDETKEDELIFDKYRRNLSGYYDMYEFISGTVCDKYISHSGKFGSLFSATDNNDFKHTPTVENIINTGNILLEYDKNIHNMARRANEFEVILIYDNMQYNVAVMNSWGNSYVFEDSYNNHDGVIMFTYTNKLRYKYSLFADKNNISPNNILPCDKIAKIFGGGGHPTAAGFTVPINIFEFMQPDNNGNHILDVEYVRKHLAK